MVGKFAHAGIAWPIGEVTAEFEYERFLMKIPGNLHRLI